MFLLSINSIANADASKTPLQAAQLGRRLARRRSDDFLDGMICDDVDYTWKQDWQPASGFMEFSAPEQTSGFNYVFDVTDGSDLTGITWWDGEVGSTPTEQTASDGSTFWVLDPRDAWFDNADAFSHYMTLAGGAVPGDGVDLYYCYAPPTPEPTPQPTAAPTDAPLKLYWDSVSDLAGTVANIVGFLAQSSWESAMFTACDENNHTGYTKANPNPATGRPAECSQREHPGDDMYHEITQSPNSCTVTTDMHMTAQTKASWVTNGFMECKPDPTDGSEGTDTAGCCWWGRGAIQTTGPGNYGDLQHDVISKRPGWTAETGIDLCKDPEALCKEDDLKWLAGVYYWVAEVQSKSCFKTALEQFVKDGITTADHDASDDCKNFAVGIGGAVNNGGWNSHAHGEAGRIGRFDDLMVGVNTALADYAAKKIPAAGYSVPTCTGNAAVDTILDASKLETVAKIDDLVGDAMTGKDASVYTWAGLCEALKEFLD